jgi:hypothetical protein
MDFHLISIILNSIHSNLSERNPSGPDLPSISERFSLSRGSTIIGEGVSGLIGGFIFERIFLPRDFLSERFKCIIRNLQVNFIRI